MMLGKRTPFADLPVNYQQNLPRGLPPKDQKPLKPSQPAFQILDDAVQQPAARTAAPKAKSDAQYNAVILLQQRALDRLAKANAFLRWRLAMSHRHRPHPVDKAEQAKWATPKKRRLDEADSTGMDRLSSSKHIGTPSSSAKPATQAQQQQMPTQSCPPSAIKGMFKEQSLLERLAALETEMQAVHLQQASPKRGRTAAAAASVFAPHSPVQASAAAPAQQAPVPKACATIACQTDPPQEDSRDRDHGYQQWMLRRIYSSSCSNNSAPPPDAVPPMALAPLGQQSRGSSSLSPVPLSGLPMLQTKMTNWRSRYAGTASAAAT